MRFFSIFFLAVSINMISAQSKVTEVVYKKKSVLQLDENLKTVSNATSDSYYLVKSASKKMEIIEYRLIFDDTESNFEMNPSLDTDNQQGKIAKLLAESLGIDNGRYYVNRESAKVIHQKEFSSDLFLIESSIDDYNWKLSNDSKKIGKYDCYKATMVTFTETVRGTKEIAVIAWYTTDIPLPYGPANFVNLPGLILELELNNVIVYAETINTNKKAEITAPKRGIKITEEEYIKLEKDGFNKYKH